MMNDLKIRIATEDDAKELLKIYEPYVKGTAITFEYEVPSVEEFQNRIRNTLTKFPYLVAEKNGSLLGYAYVSPFKTRAAYAWAVETSIYVRKDAKRMGIGHELYHMLEEILACQGIINVNACIAYPAKEDEYLTMDSVHFHEKLGYQMIGEFHQVGYKFNRWYNMVWMEKMIGAHVENQPPVIWWPQIEAKLKKQFGI